MPIILVIGAVIIAVGVGAFFFVGNPTDETTRVEDARPEVVMTETNDNETDDDAESAPETEDEINSPSTIDMDAAVDIEVAEIVSVSSGGTFSANASYLTPRRTEHTVAVTMTVANDVVTDVDVAFDGNPVGQYSNDNQARFDAAYTAQVVGKSLSDISLSRVGGASLTSQAFNEAVAQISRDAS